MKKVLMVLILFLFLCMLHAQTPPDTLWTRTYGGDNFDSAQSIQQTIDGGYIIAGATNSFGAGSYDMWLVKTDENGNKEWGQTYGGYYDDRAYSVQLTTDEGYIIAGFTNSFGAGDDDFWLVKTDENGDIEWDQTFGDSESDDRAQAIQQTIDGGFIVAGFTYYINSMDINALIIKTDENGNEEWSHIMGGIYPDGFQSVQQTTDGGYIAAGPTCSFGGYDTDFWLVKLDSLGNELWNQTYGDEDDELDFSVQQTTDGGYIIAGYTGPHGSYDNRDYLLVKTDENGNEEWSQSYNCNNSDYAESVQQTIDGGYIIAGRNGAYGSSSSDYWIVKTDEYGNEEWNQSYNYGVATADYAESIQQTTDGGYIIAGRTYNFATYDSDVWLIRLGSEVNIENNEITSICFLTQNYPNPFNPATTIEFSIQNNSKVELTIYNIKGQKIKTLAKDEFTKGSHSIIWNGDDDSGKLVSSGIYFYKLEVNGNMSGMKKMLLLK